MKYDTNLRVSIGAILCAVGLCGGCRSTHNTSGHTAVEIHDTYRVHSENDSMEAAVSTTDYDVENRDLEASERGRIEIQRDSAGRPMVIVWNRDFGLSDFTARFNRSDYGIKCVSSEDHSSAAGSVDSVDEKTEKTTTEVDASLHMNKIVMSILIMLLAVVLINKYVLPWLWKL